MIVNILPCSHKRWQQAMSHTNKHTHHCPAFVTTATWAELLKPVSCWFCAPECNRVFPWAKLRCVSVEVCLPRIMFARPSFSSMTSGPATWAFPLVLWLTCRMIPQVRRYRCIWQTFRAHFQDSMFSFGSNSRDSLLLWSFWKPLPVNQASCCTLYHVYVLLMHTWVCHSFAFFSCAKNF